MTHELPGPDGSSCRPSISSRPWTRPIWELNIWYHILNCGYRTRISGETDFPCITGDRVGRGRSYVKLEGKLDFDTWCQGIHDGKCYVSDAQSHLMDFKLDGLEVGEKQSEVRLSAPGTVQVTVKCAARQFEGVQKLPQQVEVIVNGYPVSQQSLITGWQNARSQIRCPDHQEQLGRLASARLVAHQPDLRDCGRQADTRQQAKRRVVPGERGAVLEAKGAVHRSCRA